MCVKEKKTSPQITTVASVRALNPTWALPTTIPLLLGVLQIGVFHFPSLGVCCGSAHPKPYDPPEEKMVIAKVKGEELNKKLKTEEQNEIVFIRQ